MLNMSHEHGKYETQIKSYSFIDAKNRVTQFNVAIDGQQTQHNSGHKQLAQIII